MSVSKTYVCNFCQSVIPKGKGIGLLYSRVRQYDPPRVLDEVPMSDAEDHHLCFRCLSEFQSLKSVCGGGIRGCIGGPNCTSDHK